jgi:O-methyltransferase
MLRTIVRKTLNSMGYELMKKTVGQRTIPADMEHRSEFNSIYDRCAPNTKTSPERMFALYEAVRYIIQAGIPGDFVECGVWKGGSSMVMAFALRELKHMQQKIYLYDTFEGMTRPTEKDTVAGLGLPALPDWEKHPKTQGTCVDWCYAPLDEVKKNMSLTGYPEGNLVYVKGLVEETIPRIIPGRIALLRLDTDWYESTYHELKHLFPLLSPGGVLIIDDYGHWAGAREAVDQYFSESSTPILLHRVDYTGRVGIKIR